MDKQERIKEIIATMNFIGIPYKCIKSVSNDADPKIVYEMTKGKQDQVIRFSTIRKMYCRATYIK